MARIPLSKIELDEDEMIVEGFEGELEGIRVWVTAVLERTCVYETPGLERRLVNKSKVLVERELVPIRRRKPGGPPSAQTRTPGRGSDKGRVRPPATAGDPKARGDASDIAE